MKIRRLFPILLSICMLLGLFAGCGAANPGTDAQTASPSPDSTATPSSADLSGRTATVAASYDEVYKAINAAMSQYAAGGGSDMALDGATSGKGALTSAPAASADSGAVPEGASYGGDYSQTNVQVKGVDEGDIVKTDGNYIYVLRNNELLIFKADGASTTKVSSVKIGNENNNATPAPGNGTVKPMVEQYISEYASDIYITGDIAVIVASYSSYIPYAADGAKTDIAYGSNKQISKIFVFDITDRANPSLKTELGQDGYLLTTRLIDKTLYMITSHYVYNATEGDSGTFIPSLYVGNTAKLVNPEAISIMPYINSTTYTIACSYNLSSGTIGANQTLLGGGTTVYMNTNSLFIANSTTNQTAGTPYTDSIYTVIDYTTTSVTDLASFDLTGGGLTMKASGSVPGSLNSQFNMDEYNGNLRLVTTSYSQSWSEYTDKAKGFVNYIWKDPASANALYVLDGSLKQLGSVENLAPGEQVYSARFDGNTGYFVTFRQVDPLFAVDLTDPAKPTVLSALKIPGFSEYLHIWGDGRLFGLGMNADAETGRTDGMKLAMFDTTDPANVTVKHEMKLESGYSTALYNHKAILISPEKGLIAFPADNGYDIYTYSDEQGFVKKATISAVQWSGDSRGLYIGELAYIIDNSAITVLDLTNYKLLNTISY